MSEVGNAIRWFTEKGIKLQRSGRDMPGSNWHTYLFDPDGHQNELYYGIEQIGWNGHSKPRIMYDRGSIIRRSCRKFQSSKKFKMR